MKYVSRYYDLDKNSVTNQIMVDDAINAGFVGYADYYDPSNDYSTSMEYVNYTVNPDNPNYLISTDRRGNVIGTLTISSALQGNDTRLRKGRNYCKSIEHDIYKRLMPPDPQTEVKGKLKIFVNYLQSLLND